MGLKKSPFCTPKFFQPNQLFPEEGRFIKSKLVIRPNSPGGRFIIYEHQLVTLLDCVYSICRSISFNTTKESTGDSNICITHTFEATPSKVEETKESSTLEPFKSTSTEKVTLAQQTDYW